MTRREIVDRLEMQAAVRARKAQAMETRRPWLTDAQPNVDDEEDSMDGGPRMLAFALLMSAVVLVLVALSCRAWAIEDDLAAKRVTRAVAVLSR